MFVNPDTEKDPKITRKNLTAQISYDDGENWSIKKVLDPGFAGYSDLAIGKKGEVYCLYESNQTIEKNYKLVLIRTTIDQLIQK